MLPYDLVCDPQPEAGAGILFRGEEWLEDVEAATRSPKLKAA
jgi:hypothetical protein